MNKKVKEYLVLLMILGAVLCTLYVGVRIGYRDGHEAGKKIMKLEDEHFMETYCVCPTIEHLENERERIRRQRSDKADQSFEKCVTKYGYYIKPTFIIVNQTENQIENELNSK